MFKVNIKLDGTITRQVGEEEKVIGTFSGYTYSDFAKYPNIFRASKFKLGSGETVTLAYGGLIDGEFHECCHIKCVWGTHCLQYKKNTCMFKDEFKDVGYYILD